MGNGRYGHELVRSHLNVCLFNGDNVPKRCSSPRDDGDRTLPRLSRDASVVCATNCPEGAAKGRAAYGHMGKGQRTSRTNFIQLETRKNQWLTVEVLPLERFQFKSCFKSVSRVRFGHRRSCCQSLRCHIEKASWFPIPPRATFKFGFFGAPRFSGFTIHHPFFTLRHREWTCVQRGRFPCE